MTSSLPVNTGKRLVEVLAIAIVYIATAELGFLKAIPPGNVTVIWPPSGIALTAMLLLGYRAWAGIWLGSFLANVLFFIFHNMWLTKAVTTASGIAVGSTLQAFLAAFLYQQTVGPSIPKELKDVFKFMALAALSCLVAATVGTSSLAFAGAIARTDYAYTWLTWWGGDLTGMLTVAPPLLVVGYRALKGKLSFLLISIGTGLSLIACYNVWHLQNQVVATYLGVSRAWLSWSALATGLLLTAMFVAYVGGYLRIKVALHGSEERSEALARANVALQTEITERRQAEKALWESESRFVAFMNNSFAVAWMKDADGRYVYVNEPFARCFQRPVEWWIGRTDFDYWPPEVSEQLQANDQAVLSSGQAQELVEQVPLPNGEVRNWLVSKFPLTRLNEQQLTGGMAVDITGRKRAEEALRRAYDELELKVQERTEALAQANATLQAEITVRRQAEKALFEAKERAQVTLASIGDGVITTDAAGRVEFLNPMAEHLLGWNTVEAQGLSLTEIFHLIDETTREPVECPLQICLRLSQITGFANPAVLIRRDGEELTIDHSAAPIRARDGRIVGVVIIFRDVTAQRQLAQQLTYQATHDALTGLINRQEFERRLELMLKHAKEQHYQHVLCYLDLDQIKVVNDICGHIAGDELLRQLSALLKTHMRERDTLARLGGDEFGVLLGECPLNQAVRIANQLRELIQNFRFVWQDKSFSVGVSIGLAPITETSSDPPSLLSAADSACFAAKERGRNLVHVYQPGDTYLEQRRDEMRWITQLHQTLVHDRLCLYYQPIVPLSSTEGVHGEILLRLKDEQGRTLLPGAFILAAERYNQMLAIDRWVVRSTLAALCDAPALASITYSINLSGQSLGNAEFLHFVMEEIDRTSVTPSQICFEITETAAIANLSSAMNFIYILKKKGCCFALDDFGSGLSSFAYLKALPVDFLKIDGRFIKDMINDPIDCAMVDAIHRVGHVMSIKTIAEWVENEAILEKLKAIGINYAQGFGIAKPRPFLEAREALWQGSYTGEGQS